MAETITVTQILNETYLNRVYSKYQNNKSVEKNALASIGLWNNYFFNTSINFSNKKVDLILHYSDRFLNPDDQNASSSQNYATAIHDFETTVNEPKYVDLVGTPLRFTTTITDKIKVIVFYNNGKNYEATDLQMALNGSDCELIIDEIKPQTHTYKYDYYIYNEDKIKAYRFQKTSLSNASLRYNKAHKYSVTSPTDYVTLSTNNLKNNLTGEFVFTSTTSQAFNYSFKDINGNTQTVDSEAINVIQIHSDKGVVNASSMTIGTEINVSEFLNSCNPQLKYTDNALFPLKNSGINYQLTLLVNGIAYTEPTLKIIPSHKNNIYVKCIAQYGNFEQINFQNLVNVVDNAEYPITWELTNNKTDFTYGDTFSYGNSAVLKTYNYNGDLITTLTGHNAIHEYINKYNLLAYYENELVNISNKIEIYKDGEQKIILKNGDIAVLELSIYCTYPEKMFKITRNNLTYKVDEGTGLDLKATGEITKVEVVYRHNLKGVETYTTTTDVTNTVTWSRTLVTLQEAYASDVAIVLLTQQRELLVESRIEISVTANVPTEIVVTEDTTLPYKTYWSYKGVLIDSGTNLEFNKPTNLSYALKYKDGTTKPVSTGIYFKNTKYSSTELNDGDELIPNITEIAVCYDYNILGINLFGSFNLHLENDYVMNLSIRNTKTIYFGNFLKKEDLEVEAKIGNGTNIRITKPIDNYQFAQSERILETPTTLTVLVDEMTFNVTGSDLILTFNKPTFKDYEIIRNDIKLAYVNNTTPINLDSGEINIIYNETDYIETINIKSPRLVSYVGKKVVSGVTTSIPVSSSKFAETFTTGVEIFENCYFEITFRGSLMSTDKTISNVLPFILVKQDIAITGLTVMNPKTEYQVGDKFLNESDDTLIHVVTTNSNFNILLRNDFPLFIINPARNTIFNNTSSSTNVTVTYTEDSSISTEYTIKVGAKGYTSSSETLTLAIVGIDNFPSQERYKDVKESEFGYLALVDINDTIVTNGERVINVPNPYYYGYIDNFFNNSYNARVVLFDDFIPESDGASNITVKYPSYVAGQADNINNCHFGILFGANNATNRLFVSGNKNIPNADFHSAELNVTNVDGEVETTNGDFSYFAWESIMYYGETDNKVIGYDIVSNDKLLVLKNKSDKEKTIYFRTPITLEAIDASGSTVKDINGNALAQEEFALVKGNNSNAGINPKSIINFNGDTLFIDNHNELVGLDLTGIIGDSQRYANSKSIYIDRKLKEYDLSDSILYTNQNYLFLTIKDLGIFVTHYTTKSSDNGQYEWWLLDSRNPTCFIEIDNTIYFGNDKGCFYSFNNNKYEDEDKVFANGSACIFDYNNEKCFISSEIMSELDIDKTYHFLSTEKPIYYKVARISNNKSITTEKVDLWVDNDNNRIEILNNDILLPENAEYLLNHIDNERYIDADTDIFKTYGDIYKIVLLDDPKYLVLKKLVNGEYISTNARELNNAILCRKVMNCEMYELNKVDNSFKLKDDFGNITNILQYGLDLSNSFNGEIIEFKNVESHYITAPFTMGHLDYIKTIWSFTLTNDSKIPSELEVAYASNKMPNKKIKTMGSIAKEEIGLDLSDFSFKKADFDKGVVPRTYTTNRVLARQRFTCFCFRNYNNTNSVISAMTVSYSIPYKNFGGD